MMSSVLPHIQIYMWRHRPFSLLVLYKQVKIELIACTFSHLLKAQCRRLFRSASSSTSMIWQTRGECNDELLGPRRSVFCPRPLHLGIITVGECHHYILLAQSYCTLVQTQIISSNQSTPCTSKTHLPKVIIDR